MDLCIIEPSRPVGWLTGCFLGKTDSPFNETNGKNMSVRFQSLITSKIYKQHKAL